jgi:transposase-like protein
MDDLPTAKTTLKARNVDLQVKCPSCMRMHNVDLQALVDAGKGDVPLFHLRFRCSYCGHRNIDALVTPKERVLGPQA